MKKAILATKVGMTEIFDEDGVLIWNDYAHMGLTPLLRRYAELMAECDITLRFGLINARIVSVMEALNDTMKESAKEFYKKVESGEEIGVCVGRAAFKGGGVVYTVVGQKIDERKTVGKEHKGLVDIGLLKGACKSSVERRELFCVVTCVFSVKLCVFGVFFAENLGKRVGSGYRVSQ